MDNVAAREDLLMACFADFYEELAELRQAIARGRLAAYLADGEAISFAGPRELAAATADRLASRLDRQAAVLKQGGNVVQMKLHRHAQYVMAALADELLLLDMKWPGANAWQEELLERRFFGTAEAGRDFFLRLDQLLQSRARNRLMTDLASIYLVVLLLGFKGQFRSRHGTDVLANYKARLLRFIGWSGAGDDGLMFPESYRHLLSESGEHRLAPLSRWLNLAAVTLLGYLLLSSLVWLYNIRSFDRLFGGG